MKKMASILMAALLCAALLLTGCAGGTKPAEGDNSAPAIIPIPGVKNSNGIGMMNVKKSVERAVGSDIIFNS